jgi:hypothetical protein
MHRHRPFYAGVIDANIQQFQQIVFIGETAFGFSECAQLPIHRFNDVGGVNNSS